MAHCEIDRYIIMSGDRYYPDKWHDYRDSSDNLEEAIGKAKKYEQWERYVGDREDYLYNWSIVVDLVTKEVVYGKDKWD
jgi:hypothetical protein